MKTFILTTGKVALAFPIFVGIMYGLFQAGKDTDFEHAYPELYANLVDFINFLLALLVEHWLGWLIFSALLGAIWTLIAEEPKSQSRSRFDAQREKRLPRGKK